MDFLKRNSGKVALIAIIAFFTLPFIYGNEEEEDFSPFAVRSGMSYQANPISKLANKIASFYGFSKPVQNDTMASSKRTDSIKDRVSFSKENPFGFQGQSKSKNNNLVASSKTFKNFDFDMDDFAKQNPKAHTNTNSSLNSRSSKINDPVKGYVTVNGKHYDVIEDAKGERYVVTPQGHIPYKEVMQRTVSQEEFAKAKKRMPGANDMEILQTLQQEKERQAYSAKANSKNYQNYQNGAASYRNGRLSNMGGTNYARVSTGDKGFDTDALTNAYADLKGVNLKIDTSSASAGSGSNSGGSALRDSFTNQAAGSAKDIKDNVQGNVQGNAGLTPQNLAGQVKQTAKQGLTEQNNKPKETSQAEQVAMPKILQVQLTENNTYEEAGNESVTVVFISVEEGKYSPYEVWGKADRYPFNDGNERNGIVIPLYPDSRGSLVYEGNEGYISYQVEDINQSIGNIKEMMYNFGDDDKIYIDTSTMDDFSKALLIDSSVLSEYITNNPKKATIKLSGPICTPDSFKQFAEELEQKQIKLLAGRKTNSPV